MSLLKICTMLLTLILVVHCGDNLQDITEVEGLKISTLDISNSGISQLDKIYKVKSLKKLIIHRGQLPSKQINKLKTSIYIEVL